MDGNRRWAKKRLMLGTDGHGAGLKRMVGIAEKAKAMGVEYLTVFALSTENLERPKEEISKMFTLIRENYNACVDRLLSCGAAVRVIGDLSLLPPDIRALLEAGAARSSENADFTFILAIAYGGRADILQAVNRAVSENRAVDTESFSSLLYTDGVPDPDLIIRTGGELRLSNFLLWQAAYAELYFTPVLFPDFTDEEFEKAIAEYSARGRRFGKI